MIRAFAAIAACTIAAVAAPAAAKKQVWAIGDGYSVRAKGLDLASPAGREKLLARIDWASARLCRDVRPARGSDACAAELRKEALRAAPAGVRTALANALDARGQRSWPAR